MRRRRLIAGHRLALCGIALAVLAGVYGIARLRSNPGDAACAPAVETAAPDRAAGPRRSRGAEPWRRRPFRVPDLTFKDAAGRERTLAEWRGRTVLLNLWATWCVPCRKEMPALDALQGELGGPNFEVVAVNIDTRDPEKPLAFLKEIGVTHLAYYSDPEREGVSGPESGRQGLRHADDAH